jgi:hypothetical protein
MAGPTTKPHSIISPLSNRPQRNIPPTKPNTAAKKAKMAERTDVKMISPASILSPILKCAFQKD